MKLIYHKTDDNNPYSPFDSEIVSLANGQNLLLVSPYIGLSYLKRLIKISKSWKLITDFQEWIISHPNKLQRLEICDFIASHLENIKHIPDIHAKVLITDNAAFLGSANFTQKGILERTEMSVSFSETDKVNELKEWFNSLLEISTNYTKKQLFDFVNKNENIIVQPKIAGLKIPFEHNKRKTILVPLDTFLKTDEDFEADLIQGIKQTKKDKVWLNRYFDLLKDLFTEYEIDENSQKISMSVTKAFKMPVSIGQRYIICPRHRRDAIGLILPLDFKDIITDYPDAAINQSYFYRNNTEEALWVDFDSNIIFSDDPFLLSSWHKAVKTEIDRTTISGFRQNHNPYYYKVVMDTNYRKKILG